MIDEKNLSPSRRFDRTLLWPGIWIGFLLLLVFANSFLGDFHFDDKKQILENPEIRSLANWRNVLAGHTHRELLWLTYLGNYAISGYHLWSWHAVNGALHLANVLLLLALGSLWLDPKRGADRWLLVLTTAIFAVHPIQTESVTYISSRSELLAAFFSLAAMICWVKACRSAPKESLRWFFLAFGSTALGLCTKESVITLPFLFLSYELFYGGWDSWRSRGRSLLRMIPYGLLFLGWGAHRFMAASAVDLDPGLPSPPPLTYLMTQSVVVWRYVATFLAPVRLNIDPDIRWIESPMDVLFLVSLAAHLLVGCWILVGPKRHRLARFCFVWFYLALAPSSSFFSLRDAMAEHRTYFATIPLALGLAAGLTALLQLALPKPTGPLPGRQTLKGIGSPSHVVLAGATIWLVALCTLTVMRNRVYDTGIRLWSDTVKKSGQKPRPFYNLGNALFNAGDLAGAHSAYSKAIALNPGFRVAYYNRGNANFRLGRYREAAIDFRQAAALDHTSFETWFNLGLTRTELGEFDLAKKDLLQALSLEPRNAGVLTALGKLAIRKGGESSWKNSQQYLAKAIEADPDHLEANLTLGQVYAHLGEPRLARKLLRRARDLDDQQPAVWWALANLSDQMGDPPEEVMYYLNEAMRRGPQTAQNEAVIRLRTRTQERLVARGNSSSMR